MRLTRRGMLWSAIKPSGLPSGAGLLVLACALSIPVLSGGTARAQPSGEPPTHLPASFTEELAPLSEVVVLRVPPVRTAADRAESRSFDPLRFAEPFAVEVSPASHGRWETAHGGRTAVWRLALRSAGAVSLNLGFTRYRMPPGGRLFLHSPDGGEVLGPFTEADNESHGELWTPLISGGDAVIEVSVPADRAGELELRLASVNRGFRALADVAPKRHESCNVDVACPDADGYRDQVRSVGVFIFLGRYNCTGVLLNNTAHDATPYFLTARHCGFDGSDPARVARSVVVFWNYERATCGGTGSVPGIQWQTGAHFRAGSPATDFALLELDDQPADAHKVYFSGWARAGESTATAVGIHHPRGHFKSISTTDSVVARGAAWWLIRRWATGTTEGGSSGSPLFDANRRVVGQLARGTSRCSDSTNDWYGRFSNSWTGGGRSDNRLSDWLDPNGTGESAIDGRNPEGVTVSTARVSVNEGGSATYTVKLDSEPTASVVITPTSGDTGAVTVSTAATNDTLTFTTSNWPTAQTVTVTGVEDTDYADESVTVTHAVSGAGSGYESVTAASVTVAVDDDEVAPPPPPPPPLPPPPPPLSSDATLSALVLSVGAPLAFAPETESYAVAVPYAVASITVTPSVNHADATVTVNGVEVESAGASAAIALAAGETLIEVAVTAASGARRTYRVTVTRAPAELVLFPAGSGSLLGAVRVVNESDAAGTVRIRAFDDAGTEYDALTLAIGANEARHFNSTDLESGNPDKGLSGATGAPEAGRWWRLVFESDLGVRVMGYVRTGPLGAMHDEVRESASDDGYTYEVVFFNPASNAARASVLRVVNRSDAQAAVTIMGLDDAGRAGEEAVTLMLPAGAARMLSAQELESGGEEFEGGARRRDGQVAAQRRLGPATQRDEPEPESRRAPQQPLPRAPGLALKRPRVSHRARVRARALRRAVPGHAPPRLRDVRRRGAPPALRPAADLGGAGRSGVRGQSRRDGRRTLCASITHRRACAG